LILKHQAEGTIGAAWLNREKQSQKVTVGNYTLDFGLRRNRRAPDQVPELGYGLAMAFGPDEYLG